MVESDMPHEETVVVFTDALVSRFVTTHCAEAIFDPVHERVTGVPTPAWTRFGDAVMEVGPAPEQAPPDTVIVASSVSVLLPLVQDTVYVVFDVGETERVPEVAPPVLNPPPVQDDALLELQVSVDELPEVIEVGFAVRLTETVPPPPTGGA